MNQLATISLPGNATPEQRIAAVQCYLRDFIIPAFKNFKDTLDLKSLRSYSCATQAALEGLAKLYRDKRLSKEARLVEYRAAEYATAIAENLAKAVPVTRGRGTSANGVLVKAGFPSTKAKSMVRFTQISDAEKRKLEALDNPPGIRAAGLKAPITSGQRKYALSETAALILGGSTGTGLSAAVSHIKRAIPLCSKLKDLAEVRKVRAKLLELKELADDALSELPE